MNPRSVLINQPPGLRPQTRPAIGTESRPLKGDAAKSTVGIPEGNQRGAVCTEVRDRGAIHQKTLLDYERGVGRYRLLDEPYSVYKDLNSINEAAAKPLEFTGNLQISDGRSRWDRCLVRDAAFDYGVSALPDVGNHIERPAWCRGEGCLKVSRGHRHP